MKKQKLGFSLAEHHKPLRICREDYSSENIEIKRHINRLFILVYLLGVTRLPRHGSGRRTVYIFTFVKALQFEPCNFTLYILKIVELVDS